MDDPPDFPDPCPGFLIQPKEAVHENTEETLNSLEELKELPAPARYLAGCAQCHRSFLSRVSAADMCSVQIWGHFNALLVITVQ